MQEASQRKVFMWIVVEFTFMFGPVLSLCDVVTQELSADSSWRSFTSVGYNEGSGSYISDMDCWWRIDSGADDLRLLLFLTFDTACPGDQIDIYDGNSASASALANNKCGTPASPSHYSTTQRYTYIRMVTDASVQKAGFKMEFLAAKDYSGTGCTSTQALPATDAIQILSSPNFPGLYNNAQNCRWVITSTSGSVDLNVVFSDIEDDIPGQCSYDKYAINDGDDRCDNNVISTVCSQYPKVAPFTFTSSGSSVLISFVSDSSVGRHGFLIKYKSNVTETTTTAQTTEPTQTTSTVLKTISKNSSTCIDMEVVIGIVFGSLGVVIFSYTFIVLMIIRSYNIQLKTVKPKL
ncbi:deleted in malignant brain tumors 1 protein-like [Ostrea edulis]|uniref:deleted in malignant brain tumors 1 protein-like n=1 Tax=Ostrea edulis TaxID=37623 RepID=UPI0024AF2BDF|nr:deleted in malignant brain tumors 1 protein-like [Ostrea edulis]